MNQNRNTTLEVIKLFAAYMVIFIHVPFPGNLGSGMNALARFAVPLFFFISGFYSRNISLEKIKKRIIHIFHLCATSACIFTLWKISYGFYSGGMEAVRQYLCNFIHLKTLIKLIVFNAPISTGHLWFLPALIYVYVIFYLITKYKISDTLVFGASFSLLVLHLFLGEILSVFGIVLPIILVRNFLLMGFPFFGIGLYVKKHETAFQSISNKTMYPCFLIGIVLSLASRFLFGKNELFFGSLLILSGFIVLFLKNPRAAVPDFLLSIADCNTYIYIFHTLVSVFASKFFQIIGLPYKSMLFQVLYPLIICIASTLVAYCINQIIRRLHRYIAKRISAA